nr:hypothetical protein [Oxynema aestuarii]
MNGEPLLEITRHRYQQTGGDIAPPDRADVMGRSQCYHEKRSQWFYASGELH